MGRWALAFAPRVLAVKPANRDRAARLDAFTTGKPVSDRVDYSHNYSCFNIGLSAAVI
jgi:hypothetical protein